MLTARRPPGPRIAVLVLMGIVALAYWPGLGGAFLFDDYANLYRLDSLNSEPSLYNYVQYVLGGKASIIGRPLANLTFALQHASWDARPQDFLLVNLLLHLANAGLWFAVVARLQRLGAVPAGTALPLLACAVWALLPVQGGAVLYIVQRMALLSATFVLLGLLLYLAGREAAATRPLRGHVLMAAGAGGGLVLGTLSKESAALLPWLLLCLEATLLASVARPRHWGAWAAVFLWLPAGLLVAYLALQMPVFQAGFQFRTFGMAERLLTEARLLFLYLPKAFLPSAAGIRFHYDDLPLSTGLLQPWTTVLAVAGWTALVIAAAALRRRAPMFAFAVGWYLIAHALESTFVPLELAFDHRNYVPTLGAALALCVGVSWLLQHPRLQRLRATLRVLVAVYLLALAGGMWLSTGLWGRPLDQARFWVERQPDSRRAVYHYGDLLVQRGLQREAAALYQAALQRWPDDAAAGVILFSIGCGVPETGLDAGRAAALLRRFDGDVHVRVANALHGIGEALDEGRCPGQSPREALPVFDAALDNRRMAPHRVLVLHASGRVLHAAGETAAGLERLDRTFGIEVQVPILQRAVQWSLELGDLPRARRYLAIAESEALPARVRWSYREEIRGTRHLIELWQSLHERPPA